jgi:hypothetical protein
MGVSNSDDSPTDDLQRNDRIAAGADPKLTYWDRASGRLDARPGLDATLKAKPLSTCILLPIDKPGPD